MNLSGEGQTVSQHSSLYFRDGDIILRAALNTKEFQVFRVHKFLLGHHSPVFADMFSLPVAESSVNDTYDGVPLVSLTDTAADVAGLLNALYNPATSLPLKKLDPDLPLNVEGKLRLATKYQIESLHQRILKHVEADWPHTLEQWNLRSDEMKMAQDQPYWDPEESPFLDDHFPEPASAIRLARDFNCPSILPAAFYQLAMIPSTNDYYDEDLHIGSSESEFLVNVRSARWELLDRDDLSCLLRGKDALLRRLSSIESSIFTPVQAQRCANRRACRDALRTRHELNLHRFKDTSPDPLGTLRALKNDLSQWGLCVACEYLVVNTIDDMLQNTWDNLKDFFHLA